MRTRTVAFGTTLAVTTTLIVAVSASAAFGAAASTLGQPDYRTGTVPIEVSGDPTVSRAVFHIERSGRPVETLVVAADSLGSARIDLKISSDTTAVVRAYAGGREVLRDTVPLYRSSFAPGRPSTRLRHNQVFKPGQALQGTHDSRTTTLTVQVKRGSSWSRVWTGAATLEDEGSFAIKGVKLPASHSLVRVVATNGFGSAISASQSVYNLGHLASFRRLVLVDKSSRAIWVIRDGIVTFASRCAVGMPWTPTPTGVFLIGRRHRPPNAVWGPWRLRLHRHVVRNGVVRHVATRFYIHGTNSPGSIGHYASHGCIRLLNRNIIRLSTVIDGYHAMIRE